VRATHGETRSQVLGSGDASQRLQRFALKQSPLTFVSASTVSGAASTLAVRVNDVLWREAASMTTLGPNDRAFVTSTSDDATTSVIFGNGAQGARLPTGVENVTAVYRTGIGSGGNVAAQQISLLATRPLGVKEVINPQPATGGANAETRDQARVNAPLAVMALDRLVAVRDYADFARTFAGIGKASAVEISDGRRQIVHLTIAGAGDIPLAEDSDLFRNLSLALGQFGDPNQPMRVATRELLAVVVSANVRVVPDYQFITVAPSIRTALLDAFSFERRDLGQDVLLSQVISVIQSVPGVSYVDVDTLDRIGESSIADDLKRLQDSPRLNDRIEAKLARTGDDPLQILPAQLAYLSPDITDALILKEITQ
jgi:predicted phage baseplate assembly protein